MKKLNEKLDRFFSRTTSYDRVFTACLITLLAGILGTMAAVITLIGGWDNLAATAKFAQLLGVVEHTYIGETDTDAAVDAACNALIDSLGDRWSYYMNEEEYENYQAHSANQYTGIGITIQSGKDGTLTVLSVAEDSPAMEAGMTAGLVLTELDGESLEGITVSQLGERIRAADGPFTLTALTQEGETLTFTLSAATLYSNPVAYRLLDSGIGYVDLANFDETCADEAIAAVEDLLDQGAAGIIFDVRDNGGGYVSELTKLLDYLLPEGEIFVSVDRDGGEKVTSSDADCLEIPMAVLVNGNSYSAAEYFAAVLREYDAAVTVGQPTTGKGRSQITIPLAGGGAVHISSRRYLTPGRVDLSEQGGIVPDIVVELTDTDTQLAAAEEFLLTQG